MSLLRRVSFNSAIFYRRLHYKLSYSGDKKEVNYQILTDSNIKGEITQLINDHQLDTVPKLFDFACDKFAKQNHLGYRKVLEKNEDGKLVLEDKYTWQTYEQIHKRVTNLAKGMKQLGLKNKLIIYADTSPEWYISAMASFKLSLVIGTLYTNLGDQGIASGINQLQAETIVTNDHLVEKILSLKPKLPSLKNVLVIGNNAPIDTDQNVLIKSVSHLETEGSLISGDLKNDELKPENQAVIMFTSGSTGDPKGVMLSHGALIGNAQYVSGPGNEYAYGYDINQSSTYAGYLPMAHIFEFCQEISLMSVGIKIGYSSPFTLTDAGLALAPGQKGDIGILKPNSMLAVPAVMNKVHRGIENKIKSKGGLFMKLFEKLLQRRDMGKGTPVLDKLILDKVSQSLGGNLKVIVVSGAPFSAQVQNYLKNTICPTILPAYGMTESSGGIIMCRNTDAPFDHVGAPFHECIKIKLRNWEEGNYKVDDPEGPKGELLVSGPVLSNGYWNQPDLTNESFISIKGEKWFCSGDIAHIDSVGNLRIIDRKKDLIKLQMGQFVSLGKVESALKLHFMVENVCVIADPMKSFCVALVVPDLLALKKMAKDIGITETENVCQDPKIIDELTKSIKIHCEKEHLKPFEIPRNVALIDQPWTPESGLVTATLKPKRKAISEKHQHLISALYQ